MSDHQGQVTSTLTTAGDTDPWGDKPPDAHPNSHTRPSNKQYGHHPRRSSPASTLSKCPMQLHPDKAGCAGAPPTYHGSSCRVCFPSTSPRWGPWWVRTRRPSLLSLILLCLFCPPDLLPFKMWQVKKTVFPTLRH